MVPVNWGIRIGSFFNKFEHRQPSLQVVVALSTINIIQLISIISILDKAVTSWSNKFELFGQSLNCMFKDD